MAANIPPKWLHGQNIPTHYTRSHGPDRKALKVALAKLLSLAEERTRECAIAVSRMQVIGHGSEMERLLGKDATNNLRNGTLVLGNVNLRLITRKLKRDDFGSGPVLALYLAPNALETYFQEDRITELIYVPWKEEDMKQFLSDFPAACALNF